MNTMRLIGCVLIVVLVLSLFRFNRELGAMLHSVHVYQKSLVGIERVRNFKLDPSERMEDPW